MDVSHIKLLLLDIDGVMTDGLITIDDTGRQMQQFHVRDGTGIVAWQRCGLTVGVLSGRSPRSAVHRLTELHVDLIELGHSDKLIGFENLCRRAGVIEDEVAYIGDDLADLSVLCRVGFPIAVADAVPEVREVAEYVTDTPGGHGAVREAVEYLLRSMNRWDDVLERYGM